MNKIRRQSPRSRAVGRPARLQHEIERVREDILHAAGRAFSLKGFDRVTIHDIAKEAGYTATSLYAYFKGKQEIIDALIGALKGAFTSAFAAEVPAGLGFGQRLGFLFDRLAEGADRWPEGRLLMIELHRSGKQHSKHHAGKTGMNERLADWLKRNSRGPADLAGRKPEEIAYVFQSLILGALFGEAPGDPSPTPLRDRFALALQICLYGIAGASPELRISPTRTDPK
jgi:AcrR family transcriptional regulator